MPNFDYTLNITKPKVILQKQQGNLTKGNGIRELGITRPTNTTTDNKQCDNKN
jgi:hypothetical protein